MGVIQLLESVRSLDEFTALVGGQGWKEYLASLAEASDADGDRQPAAGPSPPPRAACRPNTPARSCNPSRSRSTPAATPRTLRPLLARIAELRAPCRRAGTNASSPRSRAPSARRSRRTRRHRLLQPRPPRPRPVHRVRRPDEDRGRQADGHGNAAGTAYDLGRDGAFDGHAVHVLHLYTGEGFDFKQPTAAFERKGFCGRTPARTPGTPDELRQWLADARQLWLISSSTASAQRRPRRGHPRVLAARRGAVRLGRQRALLYGGASGRPVKRRRQSRARRQPDCVRGGRQGSQPRATARQRNR